MTVQNGKIAAALESIRSAVANARAAQDVTNDRAALTAIDEIEARTNEIAQAIERLESELTIKEYSAVTEQVNAMYRAIGNLQAVGATAGTRRGGYKGAATTNQVRAISIDKREQIKRDFERARTSGTAKEIIYQQLARRYKVSDRTIRRAVSNHR
jgi:hypothetical protein